MSELLLFMISDGWEIVREHGLMKIKKGEFRYAFVGNEPQILHLADALVSYGRFEYKSLPDQVYTDEQK